jgi:hypothetical protein
MLRDQLNYMNKAMRLWNEVPWFNSFQISLKLLPFHLQHTSLYPPLIYSQTLYMNAGCNKTHYLC